MTKLLSLPFHFVAVVFFLMLAVVLAGCLAGGIYRIHEPSENVDMGAFYRVSLILGAPGGNAQKGFHAAKLVLDGKEFEMKRVRFSKEKVEYSYDLPKSELKPGLNTYYFKYEADSGNYDFRSNGTLEFKF